MTATRTHVYVSFADPYLRCEQCGELVPRWHDATRCGCTAGCWNEPCRHDAGVDSTCPSWSPVDGCRCAEHLGYVPHSPAHHGGTSQSPIEQQFEAGLREMREAFVDLLAWAQHRTESAEAAEQVSAIQHRFWDGKVDMQDAWAVVQFRAWLHCAGTMHGLRPERVARAMAGEAGRARRYTPNPGGEAMTTDRYPVETLDADDDDGTMPQNVAALTEAVVGHRIVNVERGVRLREGRWDSHGTAVTLDNGKRVGLVHTNDCCAYTAVDAFLLHPERVDHVITGVGTTDGYTKWHVYADMGDVLELTVGWSCGNPFYYAYGFDLVVDDAAGEAL